MFSSFSVLSAAANTDRVFPVNTVDASTMAVVRIQYLFFFMGIPPVKIGVHGCFFNNRVSHNQKGRQYKQN